MTNFSALLLGRSWRSLGGWAVQVLQHSQLEGLHLTTGARRQTVRWATYAVNVQVSVKCLTALVLAATQQLHSGWVRDFGSVGRARSGASADAGC